MTIFSQGSSHTPRSFQCILSDDEASSSVEVLLAAVTTTAHSVSAASSHSSAPRVNRQIHPPETVVLEPQPSIVPYAQLCFNQESNTMSTMLVATKMGEAYAPNLTFSSDDEEEDSYTGWSTGCSSDESDYLDDYHHRIHGIVWISREWWTRGNEDPDIMSDDGRALLPELRLSRSNSSEESAFSFMSFKSCGKLFCHLRGDKSEHRGYHHAPSTHHASKSMTGRDTKKDDGHRFYGYQLLKN